MVEIYKWNQLTVLNLDNPAAKFGMINAFEHKSNFLHDGRYWPN